MIREPHTGTVVLTVAGEPVELRFTWARLSALQDAFGAEWETAVEEAFSRVDVAAIARILAIASGRPDAWWAEASPPLVPATTAARDALHLAFFGPGEEKTAAGEPAPASRWWTWFAGRSRGGQRSEPTLSPSGA